MSFLNQNVFPMLSAPLIVREALNEIVCITKFPPALVASSLLATIAAACQNSIDVQLPLGQVIPTSLYLLLIADSGEGKTTTDQLVGKPLRNFDNEEKIKFDLEEQKLKSSKKMWDIELKAIEKKIQQTVTKRISTDNVQEVEELNSEVEKLNQKLHEHHLNQPKIPKRYKLIHSDITPAKIARNLNENIPSMFISSDEGASLLKGQVMRDLGFLNKAWDGSSFSVDRVSSPDFEVKDARMSIFIGIQSKPIYDYIHGRGKNVREIGFLARFLVCRPDSTMGTRFVINEEQSWPKLEALCARISEILAQDRLEIDAGREARQRLTFSYAAKEAWILFRNQVEYDLLPCGYLSDVKDAASKSSNNLARLAALFHFIQGEKGEISCETIWQAQEVCAYYLMEFRRLFSKNTQVQSVEIDVIDLANSIQAYFTNHSYETCMKKSALTQYGPLRLRNDKPRLDAAINELYKRGIISIFTQGQSKAILISYNVNQTSFHNSTPLANCLI
jgi:hypothetical protein